MRRLARTVPALSVVLLMSATALASDPEPRTAALTVKKPKGFVEMFVAAVITTDGGPAVVLQDAEKRRLLPIWVGMNEAHAIQLRLENKRFTRPLTHDLLDAVLTRLGGELVKIHVSDLKGDTFIGTIFVKRKGEVVPLDARPSDSIALALGNRAPIFVAEDLLVEMDDDEAPVEEEIVPEYSVEHPPEGITTM